MRKELENIIQKQVRNEDAYSRKGRRRSLYTKQMIQKFLMKTISYNG